MALRSRNWKKGRPIIKLQSVHEATDESQSNFRSSPSQNRRRRLRSRKSEGRKLFVNGRNSNSESEIRDIS